MSLALEPDSPSNSTVHAEEIFGLPAPDHKDNNNNNHDNNNDDDDNNNNNNDNNNDNNNNKLKGVIESYRSKPSNT